MFQARTGLIFSPNVVKGPSIGVMIIGFKPERASSSPPTLMGRQRMTGRPLVSSPNGPHLLPQRPSAFFTSP